MDYTRRHVQRNTSNADSPENSLHRRRGLNTTPNSSSMSLHISKRERNDSQSSQSSKSLLSSLEDECPEEIKSEKKSPSIRERYHEYTKEEPIDETENDNKAGLPVKGWRNPSFICIFCILLISSVFYWCYSGSGNQLICPLASRSQINRLSKHFPTQSQRLWAQLRSALESGCTHNIHIGSFERAPVVILLVHGKSRDILANHSKSLFRRFIQCVGQLTVKVSQRSGGHFKGCQSLVPPFTSDSRLAFSSEAERIKQQIDDDLLSSYESGNRCFHLDNIDLLPPETVLLFHGMADSQNSPYREATLLFSLDHIFEFDHMSGDINYRSFEHQVQRYLRSIWTQNLGDDKVSALLSRLTSNIGMFYSNQAGVLPPVCQV